MSRSKDSLALAEADRRLTVEVQPGMAAQHEVEAGPLTAGGRGAPGPQYWPTWKTVASSSRPLTNQWAMRSVLAFIGGVI